MENKDTYFVAVKVFLIDSVGNFLITKDCFGDWDIPGGRLREQDFNTPLELVAARKIKEELGEDVKYKQLALIDLTASFGVGKEPTKAQTDTLMTQLPNSWFNITAKVNL